MKSLFMCFVLLSGMVFGSVASAQCPGCNCGCNGRQPVRNVVRGVVAAPVRVVQAQPVRKVVRVAVAAPVRLVEAQPVRKVVRGVVRVAPVRRVWGFVRPFQRVGNFFRGGCR